MKDYSKQSVNKGISELQSKKMIILVDDEARENEGDLIFPAEEITPEVINFILKHCSGIICLALTPQWAKKLNLSFMVDPTNNSSQHGTPFTVSIEAKEGVTTGVSAADRAYTIRVAMNDNAKPEDLARPGHVFPLIANDQGVLGRQGHTEGAIDLIQLAGFKNGAVLCELMNANGTMKKGNDLLDFAKQHDLAIVSIKDVIQYRSNTTTQKISEASITLKDYGEMTITVFGDVASTQEIVVLSKGFKTDNPYVRIHSSCFTGDILGSMHCDCQQQLQHALNLISQQGGFVIYLNQEGRGIGLANKIKAYALQQQGYDTVEANIALGFSPDLRDYGLAIGVLNFYNIQSVRLLTNNPRKVEALMDAKIEVEKVTIPVKHNQHNQKYLQTKRNMLDHEIEELI